MKLVRVKKRVISTIKHPALNGQRLYLVQAEDPFGNSVGEPFVTIDAVQCKIGQLVLVNAEGGGTGEVLKQKGAPLQSVIVGIVDKIKFDQRQKEALNLA